MSNRNKLTTRPFMFRVKSVLGKLISKIQLSRLDFVLIITVAIISLTGALFGEKILVKDGLGYDGNTYGWIAKKVSLKDIFLQRVDSYYIQRVFPSQIVRYTLQLFQLPLTTPNIVLGFAMLNVGLLVLSSLAWCLICNRMKIGPAGKLVGFLGIFGSFALTKWVSFYPVLTDVSGFAISIGMLYFYLSNNRVCLLLLTIVGAFTWPILLYEGTLFLLFRKDESGLETKWSSAPRHLNFWVALVTSFLLLFGLVWAVFHPNPDFPEPPYEPLLPISIFVTLLFWFYALVPLLDVNRFFDPKYWLKNFRSATWLAVLLCVLGVKIIQRQISVPSPIMTNLVSNILLEPIVTPGVFFVAHVFFYGPIVLLALFWWKPMTHFIQRYGLGLTLNVLLGLFIFLASESRIAINVFPLFVLPIAQVANSYRLRPSTLVLFIILTIGFSRVWLSLNNVPYIFSHLFSLFFPNQVFENAVGSEAPNIFYWMSSGPWMSYKMYVLEAVIVVIVGCLLYFSLRRTAR
ncbi:MAG: hypothetical protein AB1345_00215 [Chloroflexota bacterium]